MATPIPIIIVSYRNPQDVVQCLRALEASAGEPAFEVCICENGGIEAYSALVCSLLAADGPCVKNSAAVSACAPSARFVEVCRLRMRHRSAEVAVAAAAENLGYAGAINDWLRLLLRRPGWPGVWILNPDTKPEPSALAELVSWAALRHRGMVGSRTVFPGRPDFVQTRGLRWRRLRASTEAVDRGLSTAAEPDPSAVEARLDAPSGVSIYATRTCIERIGLMDETYFLYCEDLDWGCRAKQSGGIGYAHRSVVVHRGGTTIGGSSSHSRRTSSPFSVYLDFRNRLIFVRKNHRRWLIWTLLVLAVRSLEYGLVGAPANLGAALRGIAAAMAGETGRPDRAFAFNGGSPRLRRHPRRRQRLDLAISLAFHLGAATVRTLRRGIGRPPRQRLVVLYYHEVPRQDRSSFARQLDALAARASVVHADYHAAAGAGGHLVAITFDDALQSVVENAIPELRDRRMPATIFVPSGNLGCAPRWEMETASDYAAGGELVADAAALRGVASDLVRLGAHSVSHPYLSRIAPDEARREIAQCRTQMRDIFQVDARSFAFPYGDYNPAVVEECKRAGYDRVFSSSPRLLDPGSGEFVRGRTLVNASDGPFEFYLKISGAYAWKPYASAVKRWVLRTQARFTPAR